MGLGVGLGGHNSFHAAVTWLVKIEGVRDPEDSCADTSQQIGNISELPGHTLGGVWLDSPITFREGFLTRGAAHHRPEERLRPPDTTSDSVFLKADPQGPTCYLHSDLLLSELLPRPHHTLGSLQ